MPQPHPNPTFVVGAERSGTTVFRLMLAQHPAIAVCAEFEYVVDPLVGCADWPDVGEFADSLRENRLFQMHGFEIDSELSYQQLVDSFLGQALARDNKRIVVPVVHRNIDQLRRIWPDCRFIHIVRDPRDVARSVIGRGWAGNTWHAARAWEEVESTWERVSFGLRPEDYIEVRYEDLIQKVEDTLSIVCQFLGVDYDSRMLDYPDHTTYASPDVSLIHQWKRKMDPRDIALVEARVGQWLKRRGYAPAGVDNRPPSLLTKCYLGAQNKLYRLRHNARVLGLRLFCADLLSRKLRIKPWQQRVKVRVRQVRMKRLK